MSKYLKPLFYTALGVGAFGALAYGFVFPKPAYAPDAEQMQELGLEVESTAAPLTSSEYVGAQKVQDGIGESTLLINTEPMTTTYQLLP